MIVGPQSRLHRVSYVTGGVVSGFLGNAMLMRVEEAGEHGEQSVFAFVPNETRFANFHERQVDGTWGPVYQQPAPRYAHQNRFLVLVRADPLPETVMAAAAGRRARDVLDIPQFQPGGVWGRARVLWMATADDPRVKLQNVPATALVLRLDMELAPYMPPMRTAAQSTPEEHMHNQDLKRRGLSQPALYDDRVPAGWPIPRKSHERHW